MNADLFFIRLHISHRTDITVCYIYNTPMAFPPIVALLLNDTTIYALLCTSGKHESTFWMRMLINMLSHLITLHFCVTT